MLGPVADLVTGCAFSKDGFACRCIHNDGGNFSDRAQIRHHIKAILFIGNFERHGRSRFRIIQIFAQELRRVDQVFVERRCVPDQSVFTGGQNVFLEFVSVSAARFPTNHARQDWARTMLGPVADLVTGCAFLEEGFASGNILCLNGRGKKH